MSETFQGSSGIIVGNNLRIPAICYSTSKRRFGIEPIRSKIPEEIFLKHKDTESTEPSGQLLSLCVLCVAVVSIFGSPSKQVYTFSKMGYRDSTLNEA